MRNLVVGVVAFVLTIAIAVIPQTPAAAHHSVLSAGCEVIGQEVTISGVSASWSQDPANDGESGNPHIDIEFDGVVVATGAYTAANGYEFPFGPIAVSGPGPISVSSVAVEPWNNGTGLGQTDTVSVSLDDCEVPPSTTTTSTTTTSTAPPSTTTTSTTDPPTTTVPPTTVPPSTTTTVPPTTTSSTTTPPSTTIPPPITSTTVTTTTSTTVPPSTTTTEPPIPPTIDLEGQCDNHDSETGAREPIVSWWSDEYITDDTSFDWYFRIESPKGTFYDSIFSVGLTSPGRHDSWGAKPVPAAEIWVGAYIDDVLVSETLFDCSVVEPPVIVDPPPVAEPPPPELPYTGSEIADAAILGFALLVVGILSAGWAWWRRLTTWRIQF